MEQYNVTGMTCAACQARVEKAVSKVPGVTNVSVSLLTNSMGVEGTASAAEIIKAVEDAGYGASKKNRKRSNESAAPVEEFKDTETPKLVKRLVFSVLLSLFLMYFSMGHMMWGWPLPAFFSHNHMAIALVELLIAALVMIINQKFFISGFKGLLHRSPNMDTLVAMGSFASFAWSTYVLFRMTLVEDPLASMALLDELYFESAAMILALITVGKTLESYSKGKTTNALKSLMQMQPKRATVIRDGKEIEISATDVVVDEIFLVRPGESIPVDGVVLEGESAVNEAALTGESIPVDKEAGSKVSAATINQSGFLKCKATQVGEDTTLSKIIQMVSDAAATKAPIARIADQVSGVFVPIVIGIAVVTFIVWMIVAKGDLAFSLARGISVLVISCPCALGLATPVAIMVGNGMGARNGILFKTSESLEETGKAQIVVLDKTGTITKGAPVVTDLIPTEGLSEKEFLQYAVSLEKKSEHPLAKAVVVKGEEQGIVSFDAVDFQALPGNGVSSLLNGELLLGGSKKFIETKTVLSKYWKTQADTLARQGKTPLFFMKNEELLGLIAVMDPLKEDSKTAIEEMKKLGLQVVMLTGDNELTAEAISKEAGITHFISGVLPDGKDSVIQFLKNQGKVIMVGDGINDAPALTRADIGIAIGAGTDVAIDAADIVLVNSKLRDVPAAIRLSRRTLLNIKENLFWAFIYNIIGIPLAAGVYIPLFGWTLNPMFGAAAMSLSSFCVVSNALRLNLFQIRKSTLDRKKKNALLDLELPKMEEENKKTQKKGVNQMIINVEGMMCMHCEARVKKTVEKFDGVVEAVADHTKGIVTVTTNGTPDLSGIKAAIEEEGYTVKGFEL